MPYTCRICKEQFELEWELRFHVSACDGVPTQTSIQYEMEDSNQRLFTPTKKARTPKERGEPSNGAQLPVRTRPTPHATPTANQVERDVIVTHRQAQTREEIPKIDLARLPRRGKASASNRTSSSNASLGSNPNNNQSHLGDQQPPRSPEVKATLLLSNALAHIGLKRPLGSSRPGDGEPKKNAGSVSVQRQHETDHADEDSRYSISPAKDKPNRRRNQTPYGRSLFDISPAQGIVSRPRLDAAAPTLANVTRQHNEWIPTQLIDPPQEDYGDRLLPEASIPKAGPARRTHQRKASLPTPNMAAVGAGAIANATVRPKHGKGKHLQGSEGGVVLVEDTPPQTRASNLAPNKPNAVDLARERVHQKQRNENRTVHSDEEGYDEDEELPDVVPDTFERQVDLSSVSSSRRAVANHAKAEPSKHISLSRKAKLMNERVVTSDNDDENLHSDDPETIVTAGSAPPALLNRKSVKKPKGSSTVKPIIPKTQAQIQTPQSDGEETYGDNPVPDVAAQSSHIIRHPLLDTYGIIINIEWRLFICTTCHSAVTTEALRAHLNDTHSLKVDASTLARILDIGTQHQIVSKWPKIDTSGGPIPAIAGLPVKVRSGCPMCDVVAVRKHIKSHIIDVHPQAIGLEPQDNIPCQVLNKGASPRNIRVIPPVANAPELAYHEAAIREFQEFTPYTGTISKMPLDDLRLVSPWVLRAGFYRCTEGRSVDQCRDFVKLPQPHEIHLSQLGAVVHKLLDDSSSLIDKTDPFVLQRLNTATPETGINHTPFHNFQEHDTTIRAYALPVTHLVASLMRRGFDDFLLPTNNRVNKALAELEVGITTERVHELLLSIWTHQWTWTEDKPNCDPTGSFLSMFTLRKDGTFAEAKDVTGIITKLTRAIRLTVLKEIHNRVSRGLDASLSAAFDHFQKYVVESSQSTFQTLQYYQHYASFLSFGTKTLPTIIYPERAIGDMTVMLFRGHRITIPQVQAVMNDLEQDIMVLLKEKVLLDLDVHVDIGTPGDRLQSTERGYSFLADSTNPFPSSQHELGERILTSEVLRKQFLRTIPGTDEVVWDVRRCREWLQALADLEALLLLSIEMKSGAPMRLTELTSTLACNIESRTRNLYAFGREILICSQYNKNTNNEQADRMIPHALSAFDADVLVQVHSLARPFAQFLASKIYPEQEGLPRAYKERLFMAHAKPLTSRDVSKLMGERTLPHLGISMSISEWRIVGIGYKNVLCTPSEVDNDDIRTFQTFQAQQSGHSLTTERRIYALTPDDLDTLSRATIQIYISVSVEWQTRLGIVPSGLSLPYWKATMKHFDGLVAEGIVKLLPDRYQARTDAGSAGVAMAIQQMSIKQAESYRHVLEELTKLREEVKLLKALPNQTECPDDDERIHVDDSTDLYDPPAPPLASPMPNQYPTPSNIPYQSSVRGQEDHSYSSTYTSLASYDLDPQYDSVETSSSSASRPHETPTTSTTSSHHPVTQNPQNPTTSSIAASSSSKRKREHEPSGADSRGPPPIPAKQHIHGTHGHPPPRDSDMLVHLRHLYGPRANWTHPGQRDAVEKLLEYKKDVIVILRTGIGKSAIALLPAKVERTITVIIIPLVVLLQDWKRRLDEMSINYEEFDSADPDGSITGGAPLILVSADKATFPSFKTALARVNANVPVVRTIVDEAHIWLTDRNFRKEALSVPSAYRTFPMQVVLLSATIPPVAEPFLKRAFGMVNAQVIRGASHRPELEYDIVRGHRSREDKAAAFLAYLQEYKADLPWQDEFRWIAFADTIDNGEFYARRFGVQLYQSDALNKADIFDSWMHGAYEGIVATSALAAGVDYPHVRLTCHFGDPYSMILFVQQSSRAGRDRQPSRCVIFPSDRPYAHQPGDQHDMAGYTAMQETIYGPRSPRGPPPCVRRQIGAFLDGSAYTCVDFDSNWALCYVCKQGEPWVPSYDELITDQDSEYAMLQVVPYTGSALQHAQPSLALPPLAPPLHVGLGTLTLRLKESFLKSVQIGQKDAASVLAARTSEVDRYLPILRAVGRECGACLMRGQHAVHDAEHCGYIQKDPYRDIVKQIKYQGKYIHKPCWFCHVASWGSDTLHKRYGRPLTCEYPNFLNPLLFEVWNNPVVRGTVQAHFGVEWKDQAAYIAWVATPDPVHSTRPMALIVWFGETYMSPMGV